MRLYSITNMYTDGIHAGIQTQHSTVRLFVKYDKSRGDYFPQEDMLYDWAYDHETTVVLNGGMHDSLMEVLNQLQEWEHHNANEVLPFAPFFEPGINNALTSISIIMPQDAIDFMSEIRAKKPRNDIMTPEYTELYHNIHVAYGRHAFKLFELVAFLPLAK
ncbi:hypothetical protein pEaSNUABM44_00090 [Erwinia phage pEa_SNUABM_44]|nr:hypothetical protein pEaSNUABM44_00090 [Erwinia phage pEa_SNUABM_44]